MPQKSWAVGEEVLAADFNTYMQNQVVPAFTDTAQRDSQWPSPPAGATCVTTDTGRRWQYIGSSWYTPNAVLGLTERTSDTGSISPGSPVAVSGLTVTATIPAGRRILVWHFGYGCNGTGDDGLYVRIYDGATQIGLTRCLITTPGFSAPANVWRVITPSAGSHTFSVSTQSTSFNHVYVGSTTPMILMVVDMGAA